MNKYTEDGNHIIDATGKLWPVDVPHLLPLPEGISRHGCIEGSQFAPIGIAGPGELWCTSFGSNSTHWIARRPLPPVPVPKTQDEIDHETAVSFLKREGYTGHLNSQIRIFKAGISHGRNSQKEGT